jgi:hypothetical protein
MVCALPQHARLRLIKTETRVRTGRAAAIEFGLIGGSTVNGNGTRVSSSESFKDNRIGRNSPRRYADQPVPRAGRVCNKVTSTTSSDGAPSGALIPYERAGWLRLPGRDQRSRDDDEGQQLEVTFEQIWPLWV